MATPGPSISTELNPTSCTQLKSLRHQRNNKEQTLLFLFLFKQWLREWNWDQRQKKWWGVGGERWCRGGCITEIKMRSNCKLCRNKWSHRHSLGSQQTLHTGRKQEEELLKQSILATLLELRDCFHYLLYIKYCKGARFLSPLWPWMKTFDQSDSNLYQTTETNSKLKASHIWKKNWFINIKMQTPPPPISSYIRVSPLNNCWVKLNKYEPQAPPHTFPSFTYIFIYIRVSPLNNCWVKSN